MIQLALQTSVIAKSGKTISANEYFWRSSNPATCIAMVKKPTLQMLR